MTNICQRCLHDQSVRDSEENASDPAFDQACLPSLGVVGEQPSVEITPHRVQVAHESDLSAEPIVDFSPLKRTIARAYMLGNTALCMATGALAGLVYQITQAHCLECWTTKILPLAMVAAGAGWMCRMFDVLRAVSIRKLRGVHMRASESLEESDINLQG